MPAKTNPEGLKYGRLLVVEHSCTKNNKRYFLCRCDCGNEKIVPLANIVSGNTSSCGCLQKEIASNRCRSLTLVHGKRKTTTYAVWTSMKQRCLNEKSAPYKNYGGRGISVCDRWISFENFLADMGEKPDGYELDRIDNNGNYTPDNCRWATRSQNIKNSRARVRGIGGRLTGVVSDSTWEVLDGVLRGQNSAQKELASS